MLARVPRHPIGWLICTAALGSAVSNAGGEYATYAHFVKPLPAERWAGWVGEWASAVIILIPAVALLLFPDGRLPSRRWRPALWCGLAATVLVALGGVLGVGEDLTFLGNPFLSEATAKDLGEPFGIGWALMVPATVAGLAAVRARRRSAQGEMREQLWLLQRAALVVALAFIACLIGASSRPPRSTSAPSRP